jgi:hypothetical protein
MPEDTSADNPRTIPVDPVIHVETFATHLTLTWKARTRSQFVEAVRALDAVPSTASVVVDDTAVAGRQHHSVSDLGSVSNTTTYLRIEPETSWTLSWEQRTDPTVSVSGTPPATLCRRLHRRTTDCSGWCDEAVETLRGLIKDGTA